MMYRFSFVVLFFFISVNQMVAQKELLPKAPLKKPLKFNDKCTIFSCHKDEAYNSTKGFAERTGYGI